MHACLTFFFEGSKQFLLFSRQSDRRLDRDFDVKVACHPASAKHGHAFTAQSDQPPALGAFGDIDLGTTAIAGGDLDGAPKRCRDEGNRRAAMKIMPIPLENRMRGNSNEDVEIARWATVQASLAFAGQTDPRSFFNAGWNLDSQRALLR